MELKAQGAGRRAGTYLVGERHVEPLPLIAYQRHVLVAPYNYVSTKRARLLLEKLLASQRHFSTDATRSVSTMATMVLLGQELGPYLAGIHLAVPGTSIPWVSTCVVMLRRSCQYSAIRHPCQYLHQTLVVLVGVP